MNLSETQGQVCWRCGRAPGDRLACAACDAPQPLPAGTDHFQVLGLSRGLNPDAGDLERRYHAASRRIHPDRHQTAEPRAQQLSVAASAAVNRAYRTLRDPVTRAKYWLELHGVRLNDDNRVPPSLAALVFDTQEQLEELRHAAPESATGLRGQVEIARGELEAHLQGQLDGVRGRLEAWTPAVAAQPPSLDDLKQRVAEINYLRTLLGDVEDALGEPRGTDRRH